jgi:hypothetical protein
VIGLVQVGVADAGIKHLHQDIVRTQITPLETKGDNGVSDDCARISVIMLLAAFFVESQPAAVAIVIVITESDFKSRADPG